MKDRDQEVEAEQLLKKAVEIRPSFAAAWMNLGIVLTSLKKYEEAESSYMMSLKHKHNYPDCYFNLGNLVGICARSLVVMFLQNEYGIYSKWSLLNAGCPLSVG